MTEIPYLLSHNDRDRRGYPIPYIVYRDKEGKPHFTINDMLAHKRVLDRKLCALCGKPHKLGAMWFTGGAGAAFHEAGAFIDPPCHEACGAYALRVCPYLAAPNYSKRIDDRTLKPSAKHEAGILQDTGMDPERPPFFVFARASGYRVHEIQPGQYHIEPRRPWKEIQYWLKGEQITQAQAAELLQGTEYAPERLAWWPGG